MAASSLSDPRGDSVKVFADTANVDEIRELNALGAP